MKNSHIYTLKHGIASISKKQGAENDYTLKNHSNDYINDRKGAMTFKMIDTNDDLLTLKKEDEYKLILKDNDLNRFAFDLKEAGYLLNALNKVVFATSKVMLHVAACFSMACKML